MCPKKMVKMIHISNKNEYSVKKGNKCFSMFRIKFSFMVIKKKSEMIA
jgi:hypothetical protein